MPRDVDLGLSTSKIMLKEISCEKGLSEGRAHLVKCLPCKYEKLHWLHRTHLKSQVWLHILFTLGESQKEVYCPDSPDW